MYQSILLFEVHDRGEKVDLSLCFYGSMGTVF
jgi:hypothetical protein